MDKLKALVTETMKLRDDELHYDNDAALDDCLSQLDLNSALKTCSTRDTARAAAYGARLDPLRRALGI